MHHSYISVFARPISNILPYLWVPQVPFTSTSGGSVNGWTSWLMIDFQCWTTAICSAAPWEARRSCGDPWWRKPMQSAFWICCLLFLEMSVVFVKVFLFLCWKLYLFLIKNSVCWYENCKTYWHHFFSLWEMTLRKSFSNNNNNNNWLLRHCY